MKKLFYDRWGLRPWVNLTLFLLIVILIIVGSVWAILQAAETECRNVATITGRAYEWRALGGCFLDFDGKMIPLDVWKHLTVGTMP